MEELTKEIKEFLKQKKFMICLIITAIASYGFTITHISIGIDDLCSDRYVNGPFLFPQKRWGTTLLYKLLGIEEYTPFWLEFAVVLVIIITAIVLCAIIKVIVKDKISEMAYIVGACTYISFPIHMYQMTYQPTNLSVAISNLLMILAIYFVYKNFTQKHNKWNYVFCWIVITIASSMYEACIQTYIAVTFIVLLLHLKYVDTKISFKSIILMGIVFANELLVGIIFYQGIGSIICLYLNRLGKLPDNYAYTRLIIYLDDVQYYLKELIWFIFNSKDNSMSLFRNIIILFLGVTIYDAIKNKEWKIVFLNIGVIFGNVLILFSMATVLLRSYYSWTITAGFILIYIYDHLEKLIKIKYIEHILCIICILLIIYQSKMINQLFYNEYKVTKYSENIFINQMANVITENSINYKAKKIIVLEEKVKEGESYLKTNLDTVNWFYDAFGIPR